MTARTYTAAQVAAFARWFFDRNDRWPKDSDFASVNEGLDAWAAANGIGTGIAAGGIDWARVPEGYDVVTMDANGNAFAWGVDERLYVEAEMFNEWLPESPYGELAEMPVHALDNYVPLDQWRDSLRRRPT